MSDGPEPYDRLSDSLLGGFILWDSRSHFIKPIS